MRTPLKKGKMTPEFSLHTKFPDPEARGENFFSQLDVRIKLGMAFLLISLTTASSNWRFPLTVLVLSAFILKTIEIGYAEIKGKLLAPLGVVLFLVMVQPFLIEGQTLFAINFFNLFALKASIEGLQQGILIALKVLACVSLLLSFIHTTSLPKLIMGAAWLKIPSTLVDLALLMYRYIFFLARGAVKIFQAQKLRFGYAGFSNGLRSSASLLGMVFIRAFDQAVIAQQAMNLRLYRGSFIPSALPSPPSREVFLAFLTASLFMLVFWRI
ncbi:MAG: cobalt ECF transporter T component CbiQ [bacterium]